MMGFLQEKWCQSRNTVRYIAAPGEGGMTYTDAQKLGRAKRSYGNSSLVEL